MLAEQNGGLMPETTDKPPLMPGLDLRALGLSAISASVFFAWNIADNLSEPFPLDATVISIAVDQAQLVAYLLAMSFGYVFIALGFAHFQQRKRQQPLPFSFMATSLVFVLPFVALNAALQGIRLNQIGRHPAEYPLMWWPEFTALVLSNLATVVVVIFAAPLYLNWRRVPPDQRDSSRFVALSVTAALVAVVVIAWWAYRTWPKVASGSMQAPAMIIYLLSQSAYRIVWSAGVVFMYGFAAIAVVRRLQLEHRLHVVTLAAVAAALAHWLVVYGPYIPMEMHLLADLNSRWDEPILRGLLMSIAIGVVGGPIYFSFVERAAFRRLIADLPSSIHALRRWPENREP